jgi:hypothetical protein
MKHLLWNLDRYSQYYWYSIDFIFIDATSSILVHISFHTKDLLVGKSFLALNNVLFHLYSIDSVTQMKILKFANLLTNNFH